MSVPSAVILRIGGNLQPSIQREAAACLNRKYPGYLNCLKADLIISTSLFCEQLPAE
jgi:hypothetical protein